MSALKKVVNLLWYRTPKDHKLANELAEEFSKLEARIAELEWQPIDDVPLLERVLILRSDETVTSRFFTTYDEIKPLYTHWMPLPKPPEEK